MITKKAIKEYEAKNKLDERVKEIILKDIEEEPEMFFKDLFEHGCVSGMIGEIIYYTDTHAFAKKYLEEIMELQEDMEEATGEPINPSADTDKLNWLAWFGFEETARKIYIACGGKEY